MTRFVALFHSFAYDHLALSCADHFSMCHLKLNDTHLTHSSTARYSTDITFQQAKQPSGNIQEQNLYFCGKHKLYGYEVEVSVSPNGVVILKSNHHPGCISDRNILHRMRDKHLSPNK